MPGFADQVLAVDRGDFFTGLLFFGGGSRGSFLRGSCKGFLPYGSGFVNDFGKGNDIHNIVTDTPRPQPVAGQNDFKCLVPGNTAKPEIYVTVDPIGNDDIEPAYLGKYA